MSRAAARNGSNANAARARCRHRASSITEAIAIQRERAGRVITRNRIGRVRHMAGVDVGFEENGTITRAAVVVLSFPGLLLEEHRIAHRPTHFPYLPGFLSFRELPALLPALRRLRRRPDLLLCDGQGYAHPRRSGIASHLGLLLDIPSIGVGKTRLIGHHGDIPENQGERRETGFRVRRTSCRSAHSAALRDGLYPRFTAAGSHPARRSVGIPQVSGLSAMLRIPGSTPQQAVEKQTPEQHSDVPRHGELKMATVGLFQQTFGMFKYGLPLVVAMISASQNGCAAESFDDQRQEMVRDIEKMVRETSSYLGTDRLNERVIHAVAGVPRHEFVPAAVRSFAYANRPLPIGEGQTISQPYIVALMTDLADVDENSVVLEVGTGSGYQAAILAELVAHVYTIEIVQELGRRADATLQRLGYRNVTVRVGDGYAGWPEHAPFDAILVTAAPEQVPQPLLDQLKPGGRLVIPVGAQYSSQSLQVITRDASGKLSVRDVLPVGFVPLTRDN